MFNSEELSSTKEVAQVLEKQGGRGDEEGACTPERPAVQALSVCSGMPAKAQSKGEEGKD